MTPVWWQGLMDAIALDGERVPVALKRLHIRPCELRRCIESTPELREHYVLAVKYAKRRRWPELTVAAIFEDLSRTNMSLREAVVSRGYSDRDHRNFNAMCFRKPEWRQSYLAARSAKVMRSRAQLMGVSDDELVALGKRGISREVFRIHSMTPMPDRRAAAAAHRAARAAVDPIYAARRRAKRRAGCAEKGFEPTAVIRRRTR